MTKRDGLPVRYCNARKKTRPPELKEIEKLPPGDWAGPGYCKNQTTGNTSGRCWKHGENSPRGVESPEFLHGMRSRAYLEALPHHLRGRYATFMADPERLSNEAEIATLNLLIVEKLEYLAQHEYRPGLSYRLANEALTALRSGEVVEAEMKIESLVESSENKAEALKVQNDIERLVLSRAKLTQVQRDHMLAANQLLPIEGLMGHVEFLSRAVRDAVEQFVRPAAGDEVADEALAYVAEQLEAIAAKRASPLLSA